MQLEPRRQIYSLILAFPGLHFREVQRRLRIATGALEYNLRILLKSGLIQTFHSGRFLRFYPYGLGEDEMAILSILRQERQRRILLFLSQVQNANHREIGGEISLSPSTISWYLKRLEGLGIIISKKNGRETCYSITEPERVRKMLVLYRPSFLDKQVDKYLEAWEEISNQ